MSERRLEHWGILPDWVRILIFVTGCCAALAGFTLGGLFVTGIASFMVIGALLQPSEPRLGRQLMWMGAAPLTGLLGPLAFLALRSDKSLLPYTDPSAMFIILLWVISILLLLSSDGVLLLDLWRRRRIPSVAALPSFAAHLIALILALGFSGVIIPGSLKVISSWRQGGCGVEGFALSIVWAFWVTLLDVALVTGVVKAWRARRSQGNASNAPS